MEDAFAVCFREFAPLLLPAGHMVLAGRVVVVLAWEGGAEGSGGGGKEGKWRMSRVEGQGLLGYMADLGLQKGIRGRMRRSCSYSSLLGLDCWGGRLSSLGLGSGLR